MQDFDLPGIREYSIVDLQGGMNQLANLAETPDWATEPRESPRKFHMLKQSSNEAFRVTRMILRGPGEDLRQLNYTGSV